MIAAAVLGFVANVKDSSSSSSVTFKVCCEQPVLLTGNCAKWILNST